jgi:SAM-dependent methyltransferase
MPTLPSHQHREIAESFGVDAERYDRARPAYPDELVDRIVAGSPGPDVLDVGTGTGIAARQFQAAGCTVLGVEPDARMAEFARRSGVEVEVATFEDWAPAGRSFDAVIAGTVWHWVDPVAGVAKAARVLRPGGRLALFGHAFQVPPAVAEALSTVDLPFKVPATQNMLDGYQQMYATFADRIRDADGFDEPEQWRFDWARSYTRDEWLDQMPTQGGLTRLAPEQLAEVLAATGAAIDAMGGTFTLPCATVAVAATRTG